MSPTLHISSAVQRFEHSNVIEIHNKIISTQDCHLDVPDEKIQHKMIALVHLLLLTVLSKHMTTRFAPLIMFTQHSTDVPTVYTQLTDRHLLSVVAN